MGLLLIAYYTELLQAPRSTSMCSYNIVVATATNCSFPYTYNGGLFYGCINYMTGVSTGDEPFACLAVNATPVVCGSPGELHSDSLLTNLAI